ncbi:MAG: IS1096 element passenger TnpR family protein [Planctomycetota bacterium]
MAKKKSGTQRRPKQVKKRAARFTAKQGQYLAYLHLYRKLHRCSPSESEIAEYFGVSPPSVHQMIIKLEENGLITREPGVPRSVRVSVPREEIPPLDDHEENVATTLGPANQDTAGPTPLYTLQVSLIDGPVPEEFGGKQISRTIQIRGDQTLEDLHQVIFQAYDRFDDHFYEFQFGKRPHDPKGKRYVLPEILQEQFGEPTIAGDARETRIDALGLKVDQPFGYWFDYGDEWWHQINVVTIDEKVPRGKFPRVTKRVGKSPPQYMDEEE